MLRSIASAFLLCALLAAPALPAAAQNPSRGARAAAPAGPPNDSAAGRQPAERPLGEIVALAEKPPVVTHHTISVRGQTITYSAYAGMLPIRDEKTREIQGAMYYVAYVKDGANPASRPISFIFNGGPGSASVWLHLGAFGPKKVHLMPDGSAPPPPYTFEDNANTLLDQTDMVFIDPIGTGYSRAANEKLGPKFWGLNEDLGSVAEFIRLYLTRFDRMGSPKFLAGESYGTTRAAGLSGVLANDGIVMNGVVLISTVLNFEYLAQARGNDIAFVNFIPTYAATAWYHRKLPPDLQQQTVEQVTRQAEDWAAGRYAAALMQGNRLPADQFHAIASEMAKLTGLKQDVIELNDLRVNLGTFNGELLRDERQTVGRLDSRFTAFAPLLSGGSGFGGFGVGDPSEAGIRNTFTPVLTDYLRRELNYKSDDVYYILGGGIGHWNYPQNQYATVVPNLERAFVKNPYMKLFVAEGYFDAATPYFAVEYTLSHMSVDPRVMKDNVTVARYAAGHMVYIDEPSMKKLRSDLARFYTTALTGQPVP